MPVVIRLKEGQVGIIERNGHYDRTIFPGKIHFKVPVIEEFFLFELKAKSYRLPKFSLLIKNDYTIDVEVVTKYKIVEPRKARYDVENKDLEYTIERFVIRALSHAIGDMSLEQAVASIESLSLQVKRALDAKSRMWGFKLYYLEIKSMKKSFLAEQEREKLYDVNKSQKGTYISEIVDTSGKKQTDVDEVLQNAYGDFNVLSNMIENQDIEGASEELKSKIDSIKTQMDQTDDEELKGLQQQQIEIFRNHQEEMMKLDEKDIQNQQDQLMAEITKMAKKQEELIKKQEDLARRQYDLDQKKQVLASISEEEEVVEEQKPASTALNQFSEVEKDTFTGLLNLTSFQRYLSDKFIEAANNEQNVTIMFVEGMALDTMAKDYSVTTADSAIRIIADAIATKVSEGELVSRYSRKEFALALNIQEYEKAKLFAEMLLDAINNSDLSYMGEPIDQKIKVAIVIKTPQMQLDFSQIKDMVEKAFEKIRDSEQQHICTFEEL